MRIHGVAGEATTEIDPNDTVDMAVGKLKITRILPSPIAEMNGSYYVYINNTCDNEIIGFSILGNEFSRINDFF